jgi:hypothetical protein
MTLLCLSLKALKFLSMKKAEKISNPTFGCLIFKSQFSFLFCIFCHITIIACFLIFRNIVNICAKAIINGFASIQTELLSLHSPIENFLQWKDHMLIEKVIFNKYWIHFSFWDIRLLQVFQPFFQSDFRSE